MPTLVPVQAVFVHRDGKTVQLPLDKPFEFTEAEAADIAAANPDAVREPLVEKTEAAAAPAARGRRGSADI